MAVCDNRRVASADEHDDAAPAVKQGRVRWPDDLDPTLRKWLTRVARVGAHIRAQLAIYGRGRNVGGDSLIGNDNYAQRAGQRDRTILHDALVVAIDEYTDVLREVQAKMDSAAPTDAMPGTREKVAVMERRARAGFSIFIDDDAQGVVPPPPDDP